MKGERIDKRTGRQESDEEDDAGGDTIRGLLLSKMIIEQTINMRTSLDNFAMNNKSRTNIKTHLTKSEHRYGNILRDTEVETLTINLHCPHKETNVIQQ